MTVLKVVNLVIILLSRLMRRVEISKNSNQISDSIEANGIKISSNIVDIPALRFGTGTKIFVNAEGGTLENVETLDEYSSVNAYGIRSEGSLESALFLRAICR